MRVYMVCVYACMCVYMCVCVRVWGEGREGGRKGRGKAGRREKRKGEGGRERGVRSVCVCVYACGGGGGRE